MAFVEDLDEFLDPDEFGDMAIFHHASGTHSPPVCGLYDDPFMSAQLGEYDAETSAPRFTCKAFDVALVKRKDTVTISTQAGAIELAVLSVQPDGTGLAVVRLAKE